MECPPGMSEFHGDALSEEDKSVVTTDNAAQDVASPVLAQKETRLVTRLRIVFMAVLVISGGVVTAMTYKYTKNAEKEDFRVRFTDFARQVAEVTQINAGNILQRFETMSLQMTSYTIGTSSTWPFVTIPQYEAIMEDAFKYTGAILVTLTPLVAEDQLLDYEAYSVANQGWIKESYDYLGKEEQEIPSVSPKVYSFERATRKPIFMRHHETYYAPVAQIAPISVGAQFVNFDLFGDVQFPKIYSTMVKTRRSGVTGLVRTKESPSAYFCAPVFEANDKNSDIVGAISGQLRIYKFFENLLPEGIDGVTIVLRQQCGAESAQPISYEINGKSVNYLGPGDHHDPSYNPFEFATDLDSFRTLEGCKYSAAIYPSDVFESQYVTNNPIYYTIAVAAVFFLTALSFVVFNLVVERRQTTVVTSAAKSNAIVDSLFPLAVRERLMEEAEEKNTDKSKKNGSAMPSFASRVDKALPETGEEMRDVSDRPIADLFPSATVLFADISGFTLWSSSRTPTDVFKLLEAVYSAFDSLARKRKVFKVETIGDCYVAVCGLPNPCKDHAVVMCRFARDCMAKMSELTPHLATSLGEETKQLCMRFGLHSGPVTAGVLRGERSRFQLFGDTVNTASRMESTGQKNRIQISNDTANLLVAVGKEHWLQPREDVVVAKGKGEMQTYWVNFGPKPTITEECASHVPAPMNQLDPTSECNGEHDSV